MLHRHDPVENNCGPENCKTVQLMDHLKTLARALRLAADQFDRAALALLVIHSHGKMMENMVYSAIFDASMETLQMAGECVKHSMREFKMKTDAIVASEITREEKKNDSHKNN